MITACARNATLNGTFACGVCGVGFRLLLRHSGASLSRGSWTSPVVARRQVTNGWLGNDPDGKKRNTTLT